LNAFLYLHSFYTLDEFLIDWLINSL
jgi:hypothetical protein